MTKIEKIIIVLVIAIFCLMCYAVSEVTSKYNKKDCQIISVKNNIVTIKDKQGNLWEWEKESKEHFSVGEVVNLKMKNTGIETINTDDIIIKIEKELKK